MKHSLSITTLAASLAFSCGKKSNSNNDEAATGSDKTQIEGIAIGPLNLAIKLDAATPPAFQASTTSLADTDSTAICTAVHGGSGDSRTEGYYACKAAYEARETFFQAGPSVIRKRIDSVESRLNFYVGGLANYEIPCLDSRNTAAKAAKVAKGSGGDVEEEVPAFKLKEFDSKTTFSDGHSLDFGRKYYFSCKDSFGDIADFDVMVGRKDNSWYLGESMKWNDSTPASDAGTIKNLMSLDADDNMEIQMAIGSKSLAESTLENPETLGYSTLRNDMYKNSTGYVQVVVRPVEGIIGASTLMNTGCGQRLVMNDTAVYIEVNSNNYGLCYSNDVWINDSGYTGAQFSTLRTSLKGCLRVTGDLPEPQLTLDLCEEAGLLVAKDGGGYEDPFTKYGILNLSNNLASPPSGGYAMRAYHAGRLWPEISTDVNSLQRIFIPDNTEVVVSDYAAYSIPMQKTADAVDSDETAVNAACNAAAASREKSFTQKWELKVSDLISINLESKSEEEKQQYTEDERKAMILEQLQADLNNTGDAAPGITTTVTRSLGANFRAVVSGTYTLKYDGTTIGTATVDQSTLATDKGKSAVALSLSTIPTLTATGSFVLEFAGKTLLECSNSNSTTRKVNAQLGLATLRVFSKPVTTEE